MRKDPENKGVDRLSPDADYFVNFVCSFAIEGWQFSLESIEQVIGLADLNLEKEKIINRLYEFQVLERKKDDN
ncbi:MAG: hypothetical protein AAB546_00230 [Patescibacteria group bacterium]